MKKPLKLYLAHNLNDRKNIRKIELYFESKYNIRLFNPFYDSNRSDILEIDAGRSNRWELDMNKCRNIVKRDLRNLSLQDGLITIINKPSFGTAFEIAYAKYKNKKIFVISNMYIKHPWIKVYATKLFIDVIEFEQWLKENGYGKN